MGKTIAITNQKGGVGKTTTSVNLSAATGALGLRILLVDVDPQGNSTGGLGVNKRQVEYSTYDLMIGNVAAEDTIVHTSFENLDIIPANIELAGAEIELVELEKREMRLKDALLPVIDLYDFIFIDCPPSLGIITLNALCAADTILVPIQCEYYALEGLSQLMLTVKTVKKLYNEHLEMEGVLLTMYDGRLNLTQQVVKEVKKYFPKKVFSSVIPRAVRLSEAPSYGQPILYYDRGSKGADAYNRLASELIAKNK